MQVIPIQDVSDKQILASSNRFKAFPNGAVCGEARLCCSVVILISSGRVDAGLVLPTGWHC